MGLDLASKTGYAVIDHNKKLLKYGYIQLPNSKPPHRERFLQWGVELDKLCSEHAPKIVAIEELHMSRNLNTLKILCGLLAMTVIKLPSEVEVVTVHQGTAKKDIVKPVLGPVVGRNVFTKEDVFDWAVSEYKLKDLNFDEHNDITDAILSARWALYKFDSKA